MKSSNSLVIVGCGALKQDVSCPASELYVGPFFKSCLAYARSLTDDTNIRILSARHGLLRLDELVAPYEERLPHNVPKRADSSDPRVLSRARLLRTVALQLGALDYDGCDVVMLAGAQYALLFGEAWNNAFECAPRVECPMKGLGIGKRLRWLKQNTPQKS